MWRWYLILVIAVLLMLGAAVYLIQCFHRLTIIERLGERYYSYFPHTPLSWSLFSWLAACVPLIVVGLFALINIPTMGAVLLHLALGFLLTGAICRIFGKLIGKHVSPDLRCIIAIGLTVVYLVAGWHMANHVFETHYMLVTDKPLKKGSLRIVALADSHLGITLDGSGFAKQIARVRMVQPDAVVIVGDFVDDETTVKDMEEACQALGELDVPVCFVFGNHDAGYYNYREFTTADLRLELKANNVIILEDETLEMDGWTIIGRKDRSIPDRQNVAELAEGIDASEYSVLLDHQPNDYDAEAAASVDLVLSGHSHGGHIFPLGQLAVIFGIGDNRYGYEKHEHTDFIVTSGISGWAIPFKTGTWSEFVVIDVMEE